MKNFFVTLILLLLTCPHFGSSQDPLTNELQYEVNRIYPPLSISKEKLNEAHNLNDLNTHYKSSWVREYISVEILTSYKGVTRRAVSKNHTLSQEQKDNISMADVGTDIKVKVFYIPENTLTHNDPKETHFTFTVDPESEATFPGGQQQLKQYIKDNAIDKIPGGIFRQHQLTAIKFTIDEEGQIIDTHLFWSSEDEETDKLLLETICNMPNWKPAEYANGVKVKQEFALTVGDMKSCVVNLLNILRN